MFANFPCHFPRHCSTLFHFFRNIDPDLAANLLEQIESGADVEPILLQLKRACQTPRVSPRGGTESVCDGPTNNVRRDKVVTFQEDLSVQNI